MFKFIFSLITTSLIIVSIFAYCNSQRTFEAKFKNIDGLPVGAQVTALGVEVGNVVKTRPYKDGVIVTIKIKNKKIGMPPPGSYLTITSFRPNQGRVLEIIPPKDELSDSKALIVQEPITTESWLHASFDLLEGLKNFSEVVIKTFTHENFEKVRLSFQRASESLNQTAEKLGTYEKTLISVKNNLASGANEANVLLIRVQKPLASLNRIIGDKNLPEALKGDLNKFSQDLDEITRDISGEDFVQNIAIYKTMILEALNRVNSSLIEADRDVTDPVLKQKIKTYSEHLANLNSFHEMITPEDIRNISNVIKNAKEVTIQASKSTEELNKKFESKQN